ncbi:hypothetical protein B0I35DRAFT_208094 [Stachybotrys elegans]|uniref:Uncharacterized protein n=1 Tax=Stachybotrys elegans TaxID=80388 RepID=A0A8K0SSD9_9HYPO|nr:hypothetical protein B0I35DRAFT_208094 [Stachybotrys elegans]
MSIDGVVHYLLDRARVDVALVKITEPTKDSYVIAIETDVTGTGPIGTRVSPMELDLTYEGKCFAKLRTPELQTHWWGGAKVKVEEQKVQILDMATYRDYVQSVLVSKETGFHLENGVCTIRALGIGIPCTYRLRVPIRGMMGLAGTVTKVERSRLDQEHIAVTARLQNPSPVEMDHGMSSFEFRNTTGELISLLKGDVKIVRGDFEVKLEGKLERSFTPTPKGKLVGVGVDGDSWCKETIKYISLDVNIPTECAAALSA